MMSSSRPRTCQPLTIALAETLNEHLGTFIPEDGSASAFWYECLSGVMTVVYFSDANCFTFGQSTPANIGVNSCVTSPFSGPTSTFISICNPACFHESTVVSYNEKLLSLQDILEGKEEECTIPHVIEAA